MNGAKNTWSRIYFVLVCAYAFVIPLSQFLSVRLIAVLTLGFFIFPGLRSRAALLLSNGWQAMLYLIVLIAGLLYSTDVKPGLRILETSFSLLAVPMVFSTIQDVTAEKLNAIFKFFSLGLFIACIICLTKAFINYNATGDINVFFFEQLTDVLNSQPTYLAYYLIFAIGCGLYMVHYSLMSVPRGISMGMIVFFFLILVLTGGRTTFISLLLIFSFFVLKYLLEDKHSRKDLVFAVVCVLLVSLFVFSSIEPLSQYLSAKSDYWERSILWRSAIEANTNPLFGVGTGDYQATLNNYFIDKGLVEYAADSYNSHNQFIQVYLSNGLIGVIAFLILIGHPIYISIRNEDTLGILTLFPFVIYGVTEVFLGRYQGVVFFALLYQLNITRNALSSSRSYLKKVENFG